MENNFTIVLKHNKLEQTVNSLCPSAYSWYLVTLNVIPIAPQQSHIKKKSKKVKSEIFA